MQVLVSVWSVRYPDDPGDTAISPTLQMAVKPNRNIARET